MRQEREQQQLFAALVPEGGDRTKEARQPGGGPGGRKNDLCYECGKPGHRRSQCPGVSSGRAHATQDSGLPCPACEQVHTFKGRDGTERTSKRLGAFCAKFKQMNVEARVAPVLNINDRATGGRRTKDILGGPKGWGPKKKVANIEIYVIFEVFAFCGGRTKTDFKDRVPNSLFNRTLGNCN